MTVYMSVNRKYEIEQRSVWGEFRWFIYERWHNHSGNRGHQTFESAVKKLHKMIKEMEN